MGQTKKQRMRRKFQYKVNRKKQWVKSKKQVGIKHNDVRSVWDDKKSVEANLKSMGLVSDPNKLFSINSKDITEEGILKRGNDGAMEVDSLTPVNGRVREALEAEAAIRRKKSIALSRPVAEIIGYYIAKYGDPTDPTVLSSQKTEKSILMQMARDKRNFDQLTPKQIKRKILAFKRVPEYVEEYCANKMIGMGMSRLDLGRELFFGFQVLEMLKQSLSRFENDFLDSSRAAQPISNFIDEVDVGLREQDVVPQIMGEAVKPTNTNRKFSSSIEGGQLSLPPLPPQQVKDQSMSLEDIKNNVDRSGYVAVVVSGLRFVSPKEPIMSHASTRLGQAVATAAMSAPMLQMSGIDAASDIESHAKFPNERHETEILEFYCDRNPIIFPHILQYYRTGTLHLPHTLCWDFVKAELNFWGIDQSAIPDCCMSAFRIRQRHLVSSRLVQSLFFTEKVDVKRMNRGMLKVGTLYRFLYEVESSWATLLYFYAYMVFALLFAVSFILQLNEFFRVYHPPTAETNMTHCLRYEPTNPQSNVKVYFLSHPHPILRWFDLFCIVGFSIDMILRFICYPSKVLFLCHAPNIIELITLAGNYFSVTLLEISAGHFWCNIGLLKTYLGFEILRVFRLTRIPFFSPRYSWMRVLLLTLKRGFTELLLLIALVFVLVMFFGYLIIIPEMWRATNLDAGQKSISSNIYQPHLGMWWAIVTMATVGYGDYYPTSPIGYCIGSLCAVTGVLFLSLQVPLISNRFNALYQYAKQESNKLEEIKRQKEETRRAIVEEERIRRERFWRRQFQREENWEEAFRSGQPLDDVATSTGDYESLPDHVRNPPQQQRSGFIQPAAGNHSDAGESALMDDMINNASSPSAAHRPEGFFARYRSKANVLRRALPANVATISYRKNATANK